MELSPDTLGTKSARASIRESAGRAHSARRSRGDHNKEAVAVPPVPDTLASTVEFKSIREHEDEGISASGANVGTILEWSNASG